MEPVDYIELLRRRWRLVVALPLLAMAVAWVTAPEVAPAKPVQSWTATVSLIRSPEETLTGTATPAKMSLLAFLTTHGEVPRRAAQRLVYEGDPALLVQNVEATAADEIETLTITLQHPDDGEGAARLVNVLADELQSYLTEQARARHEATVAAMSVRLGELQAAIAELTAQLVENPDSVIIEAQRDAQLRQYGDVFRRLQELNSQPPAGSGLLTLQEATPLPTFGGGFTAPSSREGRVLLGLVLGLAAAVGAVVLLDRLDTRIRDKDDAEVAFRLPVVAEIPRLSRKERREGVPVHGRPMSPLGDAYRVLRTALQLMPSHVLSSALSPYDGEDEETDTMRIGRDPGVVLVTSAGDNEGKTTTTVNLAIAFAQSGKSVLVLDCDFRRPSVHALMQVDDGPGLADVLERSGSEALPADVVVPTPIPRVSLVRAGSVSPISGELLANHRRIIDDARRMADVVLIDTPPLLVGSEAADLVPDVDTVVVVCRAGRTWKRSAERVTELLGRLGAPVLGVALVGSTDLVRMRYRSLEPNRVAPAATPEEGNGHKPEVPAPTGGAHPGATPPGTR